MDFINDWIREFCKECDSDAVNKYVKEDDFIWHAFSFRLIDKKKFLDGIKAKKAFDQINNKDAVYYVFYPEEDRYTLDVDENMDSAFFDEFIEVYVVAKDFSWTYIKTHETCMGFGPYFMRKNR